MPAAVKGSDLNPDFSFDFGASAAQAPWEMSGTPEDVASGCMPRVETIPVLAVVRGCRPSYAFQGIKFGRQDSAEDSSIEAQRHWHVHAGGMSVITPCVLYLLLHRMTFCVLPNK